MPSRMPGHHAFHARCFGRLHAADIEVMHQQAQPLSAGCSRPKLADQHLEGDPAADVAECRTVEVEAERVRRAIGGASSHRKRACGSMKRRISQALASRSTQGRRRVAQMRPR